MITRRRRRTRRDIRIWTGRTRRTIHVVARGRRHSRYLILSSAPTTIRRGRRRIRIITRRRMRIATRRMRVTTRRRRRIFTGRRMRITTWRRIRGRGRKTSRRRRISTRRTRITRSTRIIL